MAANIIVVEKNEGVKIAYSVADNKITFGEDELTVNIMSRERDYAVTLDICRDTDNGLTVGINTETRIYVAQVEIPAREYEIVEVGVDEEDKPITERKPINFDISKCTLILWAVE